jgi:geranyl-CoA carboxylase alpha subunit
LVADAERRIGVRLLARTATTADLVVGDRRKRALHNCPGSGRIEISIDGCSLSLRNTIAAGPDAGETVGGGSVVAPMHGMLVEVFVAAGDAVTRGDRLAVLEAMKMQHEIVAQVDGTVRELHRAAGQQLAADELIMEIDQADA